MDAPRPPPLAPADCRDLRLDETLLKMLVVLYRRLPRGNPALASICTAAQPLADRQLGELVSAADAAAAER